MTAVTESQARATRLCPLTRGQRPAEYCVASSCMAWRWWDSEVEFKGPVPMIPPERRRGYCGLAGTVGFDRA